MSPMNSASSPASFGRVDPDGHVYVQTAQGERLVGQIPDVDAEAALAFYVRRYEALEVEVGLLETRMRSGALSAEEARHSLKAVQDNVQGANAVGDLDALLARLSALAPVVEELLTARKAERARAVEEARAAKEAMVAEAETLAEGTDWRGGVNRFRALLEQWQALPRIDRATDDALWHRFSTARTAYTRRRKAQFAEQAAKRDTAKAAKEQIVAEAQALADSTDWRQTAATFRELMTRWKAAGAAPREDEERLWTRFREIQDGFFNARASVLSEQEAEFSTNLAAKLALLDEAEASLLPVTNLTEAREGFRRFLERYNAHGRVPREQMKSLDSRLRALETAVREAEQAEWQRTDPQARARAEETVNMLSAEIDKLTEKAAKAVERGDSAAAAKATESIQTYTTWLDQARETLADFSR